MFNLSLPNHPTTGLRAIAPCFPSVDTDVNQPFALTLSRRAPADLMSGQATPLVLARFATLAEAMQGAIEHAGEISSNAAAQLLAILDRDGCLVLAGAASGGAVAWCHPVMSASEACSVVTEASQLRAQAGRAAVWGRARSGATAAPPCRSSRCPPRRPALARLCRPGAAGRGVRPERQRRAGGDFKLFRGERDRPDRLRPVPLTGDTR